MDSAAEAKTPTLKYEPRLDGIRAMAVSLVIAAHCFVNSRGAAQAGVGVFFVLSGFLITTILDTEHASTGRLNLRYFYVRRFLRLYPALVAFVAAYLVGLLFHLWPDTGLGKGLGGAAMALTYTTDVFTLVGKGHWTAFELLLTWTLAVEEQFYLLWPLVYLFVVARFRTWRTRMTVLGCGVVIAAAVRTVASSRAGIGLSPFEWTDALLIGCMAGLAYRHGWLQPRRLHPIVAALVAAPVGYILWYGVDTGFGKTAGLTLFDLSVAALIFHALAPPRRADVLGSKVFARLGRLSYGMYLWHSLVLSVLNRNFDEGHWPFFLAVYAVTIAAAEVSYRFIETPFLRRKSNFAVTPAPR